MGLTTLRYAPVITTKKKIDPKRTKVPHRTLLAHIEIADGQVRVLDLTNKNTDFPRVIVSKDEFDYLLFCDVIERYMIAKKFTSFTLSYLKKDEKFLN